MPKSLMSDIRTGSFALEEEEINLEDLDNAYSKDLDQEQTQPDYEDNGQPEPQL